MMNEMRSEQDPIFDYRALRLIIGTIAFALPIVVWIIAAEQLSSISAYYHTDARDYFVGALFIIGSLLIAYNGHTIMQKRVSKVAAMAAFITAIFPTYCTTCEPKISPSLESNIHFIGAIVLFSTIAYFCLGPFRENTKGHKGKKGRRAKIYSICGLIIIGSMLTIGIAKLALSDETINEFAITFWGEFVALWAFGVAWIVAGKFISPLTEEKNRLRLSI
jgi:hypothetical protein